MFKYPSPWQVLCISLERREQVPENTENGSPIEQSVTDSKPFHIEISTEYQIAGTSETLVLGSDVTKRNNISVGEPEATAKNSPTLQIASVYTDSNKTYVPEEQEANITDSQTNTGASESTMDRVTRRTFSSFSSTQSINGSQQDLTNSNSSDETQATHKIDSRKEMWVPSPDRRLKVLRGEERFKIRSHLHETSPTKLFVDSDEDADEDEVKPRSRELTPEKVLELEKDRRDIIKKQGQRKSLDTEEAINIVHKNYISDSDIDLTGGERGLNKPNIHTEQIHFESARQQFIMLEKQRNSLPITPRPLPRQSWVNTRSLLESYEVTKGEEDQEGKPHKDEYIVAQEITGKDMSSSLLHEQFFNALPVDNGEQQEIQEEKESIANPSDETPIEREIRLALQREESLRKERGILSVGETNEIIEISKNPVLANLSDIPHSKKSKDRLHTSLFIQREIEKEVQREADLKSEGRVAGLYDKGNSQELDERRRLFEQPDEIPVQPQQGTSNKMVPKVTQADLITDNETKNWTSVDSPQPYSVRMKWKPTPFNVYRNRRLSADNILDIKTPLERSSEKESSEETFVLHKENFHVQPLKFNLRLQDNDVEIERGHKIGHGERYHTRLRPSLTNIIERDIQQTLERDRELHEERRKSGLPPLTIQTDNELNSPHNGFDTHGTSSLASNVSNTWSSAPWKDTLGSKTPSYDSSTVPFFRLQGYPKFEASESNGDRLKKHENRYAGIDPSDAVNTEIVESTRVIRHKNTMALRWEAGLYANEQGD